MIFGSPRFLARKRYFEIQYDLATTLYFGSPRIIY